jgi:hypothetical protein
MSSEKVPDKDAVARAVAEDYAAGHSAAEAAQKELCEMFEGYSVVNVEGSTRVASFNEKGRLTLQRKQDFDLYHLPKGKKAVQLFWHFAPRYDGLVCSPSEDANVIGNRLNTWRGWKVKPAKGDWSLMERHIFEVIANGDKAFASYVLRWIAKMVQDPERPAEVAIFLRGLKGTGKGILGNTICSWFGEIHSRHVTNSEKITGRFNSAMAQCVFLFADEAIVPQDKQAESVLKGLITEPTIEVEPKFVNAFSVRNCLHIYGSTNDKWVAPMSADERRFAVQTVSDKYRGNTPYFNMLFKQMQQDGGAEAMLYDMLHETALGNDYHPRQDVPQTKEARRQKTRSLSGIDLLISELCDEARLPWGHPEHWDIALTKGDRSGEGFWNWARNLIGLKFLSAKTMSSELREEWGCEPGWHSDRMSGVRFPPLDKLRGDFETKYGEQDWSVEAGDWLEPGELPQGYLSPDHRPL